MKLQSLFCVAITVLLSHALPQQRAAAAEATPLVAFDPNSVPPANPSGPYLGFYEDHGNGMVGWTFELNQPVTVTQVGVWDQGGDGLSRAFQIGLWQGQGSGYDIGYQASGALLGTSGVTVPGGTAAPLNGIYRVVDLSQPLNLDPGWYELGMLDTKSTTDPIQFVETGPSNSVTTIGQFFYAYALGNQTTTLAPANELYLADGLEVGPMIFTAPEPSAGAVALSVLIATAMMRPALRSTSKRRRAAP